MSILVKCAKSAQVLAAYRTSGVIQARRIGHWFTDYKPGPLPKTEEERIAAAKKYNLLPEEYENYTDQPEYGDYPKLPYESVDSRDPWYPWDNEELRKNFNEPVNVRIINCLPEADSTGPLQISHLRGTIYLLLISGSVFLSLLLLDQFKLIRPVAEKQYVTAGVSHYTFEPDLDEEERRAAGNIACRRLGKGEKPKEGETRYEDVKR